MLKYIDDFLANCKMPVNSRFVEFTAKSFSTLEDFLANRIEAQRLLRLHARKFRESKPVAHQQKLTDMPLKRGNLKKKGDTSGFWTNRQITLYPEELQFSHKAKATAGKVTLDPKHLTQVQARGKEVVLTIRIDESSPGSPPSFSVKTFRADTEADAVQWQRAILKARHQIELKRKSAQTRGPVPALPDATTTTDTSEKEKEAVTLAKKHTWELGIACSDGNWDNVRKAFSRGGDIHAVEFGHAALHYACISGSLRVVRGLVRAKSDIEQLDKTFQMPAEIAAARDRTDIVVFLHNSLEQQYQTTFLRKFFLLLRKYQITPPAKEPQLMPLPLRCITSICMFIEPWNYGFANATPKRRKSFVKLPATNRTVIAATLLSHLNTRNGKPPLPGMLTCEELKAALARTRE